MRHDIPHPLYKYLKKLKSAKAKKQLERDTAAALLITSSQSAASTSSSTSSSTASEGFDTDAGGDRGKPLEHVMLQCCGCA